MLHPSVNSLFLNGKLEESHHLLTGKEMPCTNYALEATGLSKGLCGRHDFAN
jgi:hypothetical protein